MRIHQLPPAIANQIAAGEVIERPASVVKELLENSLDAGADAITVEVVYGGLNQIKVIDNGMGIVEEDLPLAVAAHATSKIITFDDLYAIASMGFRGEALASIASVAKVSISSRPADQKQAMMLQIEGAEMKLSPCARTVGTTIDVVDLFFNAPVRKRFLKSEKMEFQAIETVIKRFALSAPHISLILKHNGKQTLVLPGAINEQARRARLSKIFGSSFVKESVWLDVDHSGMHLLGWVSNANFQRSQNDRQWVYINQRMVKDKLINHALKQSYDGLLHPGRFPACLLYFTINTSEVDVNVHPTKHEVRFQQPRLVHDFFTSVITRALQSSGKSGGKETFYEYSSEALVPGSAERCYSIGESDTIASQKNISTLEEQTRVHREFRIPSIYEDDKVVCGVPYPLMKQETNWIILNSRYLLVSIQQQPYIVDGQRLQQHWLHQELLKLTLPLIGRPLLVPARYSLPEQFKKKMGKNQDPVNTLTSHGSSAGSCDVARFMDPADKPRDVEQERAFTKIDELHFALNQIGIQFELCSDERVLIRTIPTRVPYLDFRLFLDAIADLESFQVEPLLECLSRSQVFDLKLLSREEQMELNQLLLAPDDSELKKEANAKSSGVFYKALTIDNCRMLVEGIA